MNTIRYRTGFKRLWAAVIDWIVFLPLLLVAKLIYQTTSSIPILFTWETFVVLAPVVYSIILHYKYGQTIGKWAAVIKVLDISETKKLTFRQAIFRDGFYLLVAAISFGYHVFLLMHTDDSKAVLLHYSNFLDNPVLWWALIELTTMLTNSKRRAVHDFLAQSVVVRAEASI